MCTRHWTRKSGGTLKRGARQPLVAKPRLPGPNFGTEAQGRAAVSSRMPEWGLVAGSPDWCSRGRERIPNSILDGASDSDGERGLKLWKGERRKQRTTPSHWQRASVRVGARSACGGGAGSVARVSVTRGAAAGCACAGPGGTRSGPERSLAGAQNLRLCDEAAR
jgi:hypothetical protein